MDNETKISKVKTPKEMIIVFSLLSILVGLVISWLSPAYINNGLLSGVLMMSVSLIFGRFIAHMSPSVLSGEAKTLVYITTASFVSFFTVIYACRDLGYIGILFGLCSGAAAFLVMFVPDLYRLNK